MRFTTVLKALVGCEQAAPQDMWFDAGAGRRRWRHLDAAGLKLFLEADAPRVRCKRHGVVVAAVPWARHDAGHTSASLGVGASGDDGFGADAFVESAVGLEGGECFAEIAFEGVLVGAELGGAAVGEAELVADDLVQGAGVDAVPVGSLDLGERGSGPGRLGGVPWGGSKCWSRLGGRGRGSGCARRRRRRSRRAGRGRRAAPRYASDPVDDSGTTRGWGECAVADARRTVPQPAVSACFTAAATRPPSARPATFGFTIFMTAPMARGPSAPAALASATAAATIVDSSSSVSCFGR